MTADPHAILFPMALDEFLAGYWESRPLHLSRKDRGHLASLLSFEDIESVLASNALYYPSVQLTQKGRTFASGEYADTQQRIMALRLMQLHAEGATIVLSQAQNLFATLRQLCREVTQLLQMRCQANVYFSPAGNQGFNAHYDTHDVFILQVSGAKTFNFYSGGVDLPFTEDQFDSTTMGPVKLTESVRVEAGDTLYIPRGVVHDAVAEDQASLHVTLGLFPAVVRDLLQEMVQVVAEQDRRLRQTSFVPSPGEHAEAVKGRQSLKDQLNEISSRLADPALLDEAMLRQQEELSLGLSEDPKDALVNATLSKSLTTDSTLILKPSAVISVQRSQGKLLLHGFGQVLEFEDPMSQAIEQILKSEPFRVNDLTDLSSEQQMALCKRLLRENLLVEAT